jgi:class 3 adenylate cyclase
MVDVKDQSLVICTVFAEIVDYAKKPVAEQIKLTERFNALLSEALKNIVPDDRIVLDTGSGAAVSCLGKTEDALLVAIDLRDRIAAEAAQAESALAAHFGINVGPVKLVKEAGGEPNIIGDGITVAQSVMSFAVPGQILVSRAYLEAVSGVSPDYAKLLKPEGSRTDKYLREHQVYSVGHAADAAAVAARNQRLRMGALGAIVAILVIAVGARMMRTKPAPPPETPPIVATEAAPALATPGPATPPVTAPVESNPPPDTKVQKKKVIKPKIETAAATAAAPVAASVPAAPAAPGSLDFAITPWGEIYVDGAKRGVSPPLTQIQIAPGKHAVEIRNTSFPSYTTTVEVTSGAQSKIKYKFN